MEICIHTYTQNNMFTYKHMYLCSYVHPYLYTYIHACVIVCMHICVRNRICAHTCIRVWTLKTQAKINPYLDMCMHLRAFGFVKSFSCKHADSRNYNTNRICRNICVLK